MAALLDIGQAAAKELIDLVDGAIEQHIVIGHVEMAVIVDPAGLDPHRRADKGREERGFGVAAIEHRGESDGFPAPHARGISSHTRRWYVVCRSIFFARAF